MIKMEKNMDENKFDNNDNIDSQSVMTPWEVAGNVDYMAQIKKFGTSAIDGILLERWEKVTKTNVHHFMRRGIVFSHQDLNKILDCVEQGIPIYLYTGRGPSSKSMHLGHLIPFTFTAYLQKALNCIVIIQLSDDEKYLFKDGSGPIDLDSYRKSSYSNARDIIACGFDLKKTFLFSNLEFNGGELYFNSILLMKATNMNTIKAIYGIGESISPNVLNALNNLKEAEIISKCPNQLLINDINSTIKKFSHNNSNNIGQCVWPIFQSSPAFCTSFTTIFKTAILEALKTNHQNMPPNVVKNMKKALKELTKLGSMQSMMCLVPMAIDQAPYFRSARDCADILKCPKPAVIHSEFLPGLKQKQDKMSTTTTTTSTTSDNINSTIFLNIDPKTIEKLINKHAFSGGRVTQPEHELYGGDIRIDRCYQYLTYFLESDEELKDIAQKYTLGTMNASTIKKITANIITNYIINHQAEVAKISDELIMEYFNANRVLDIGGIYINVNNGDINCEASSSSSHQEYGINFDRTFGFICKDMKDIKDNK
jgi:tryptophanyl-tRNA synthetase